MRLYGTTVYNYAAWQMQEAVSECHCAAVQARLISVCVMPENMLCLRMQ